MIVKYYGLGIAIIRGRLRIPLGRLVAIGTGDARPVQIGDKTIIVFHPQRQLRNHRGIIYCKFQAAVKAGDIFSNTGLNQGLIILRRSFITQAGNAVAPRRIIKTGGGPDRVNGVVGRNEVFHRILGRIHQCSGVGDFLADAVRNIGRLIGVFRGVFMNNPVDMYQGQIFTAGLQLEIGMVIAQRIQIRLHHLSRGKHQQIFPALNRQGVRKSPPLQIVGIVRQVPVRQRNRFA
ncbi:MAG: hypothetical protein BWY71_00515 [Planctomycetes bacterium ADurb.Bin412]|nr:MAG: hypothetical protein BWY71_00515 [Planctomycetes bacterium ADurb.Bin412]